MVVRVLNPQDWRKLPAGQWLPLYGEQTRVVKLELNTDAPTRVVLVEPSDDPDAPHHYFLAMVNGMEKIEVVAGPDAGIMLDTDGEAWYFTNDGQFTAEETPDNPSFTKLLGRRSRSDQLELMMQMQQRNYENRLAEQAEEMQALQRQLNADADQDGVLPDENGNGLDDGSDGTQPPIAGEPTVPAAGADDSPKPGNNVSA